MSILDGADVLADYSIPSYTAGEAISAGDAVALDLSDNKIYKRSLRMGVSHQLHRVRHRGRIVGREHSGQ